MFFKIIFWFFAIILWPITLSVGALILIWACWMTFGRTKNHYRQPVDCESGEPLESFYLGGRWEEEGHPLFSDCAIAWMLLLSDAEEIDPNETDQLTKNRLVDRGIHIMEQCIRRSLENHTDPVADGDLSDLLQQLNRTPLASWLLESFTAQISDLPDCFERCLANADDAEGIWSAKNNWEVEARARVEKERGDIRDRSHSEISSIAEVFAKYMRANERKLTFMVEVFETATFHKKGSNFDWDGKLITETGLAHWGHQEAFAGNEIPDPQNYLEQALDEFSYEKGHNYDYNYGFIFSTTTVNHNGKEVPIPVDIDDVPEYYIWTVSEGAMDYDIYDEKTEGKCSVELTKLTFKCDELELVFDAESSDGYQQFIAELKSHLSRFDVEASRMLENISEQEEEPSRENKD